MEDYQVPIRVQSEIMDRVQKFNRKYLSEEKSQYYSDARGKFIYFRRTINNGYFEGVFRLTYVEGLKNMPFALYRRDTGKYDANAHGFFGEEFVNGTIEGALTAGIMVYPPCRDFL